MTTSIQSNPQYLNARTLVYTAWDLRRAMDSDPCGPGVADYESFRVQQRQAGANMSVDIGKTSVGLMQAWVRGGTRGGQGLYRVDNIDTTAPTADTYLAQLNEAGFSAADATNPRIDQVILEILDQQHAGASNVAQTRVVTGTPTGGATLDNRTGAGALSASCILLADVLIPALSSSVVTANIRDRRQFPLPGSGGSIVGVDLVTFDPSPALPVANVIVQPVYNNWQGGYAATVKRRIVGATKIRWKYSQASTTLIGNYNIAIYDASGRKIVETGAQVFVNSASTEQVRSETISATTFEPGLYYVAIGYATLSSNQCTTIGVTIQTVLGTIGSPNVPGIAYALSSGGTTLPSNIGGGTWQDIAGATTATGIVIPTVALTVG